MLAELVKKNRSYRRFYQDTAISKEELTELAALARISPSGMNRQPLKFRLVNEPEENAAVFSCLTWAGSLPDWDGPEEGERPSAYIVVLGDTQLRKEFGCDHGIASQSIMLGAVEKGYGGCMLGSVDRKRLQGLLDLPDQLQILLVLALGQPKETVVLTDAEGDDTAYYRDAEGVHYVPKRPLEELIVE